MGPKSGVKPPHSKTAAQAEVPVLLKGLLLIFVAAKKFVAFDGGDYADGAFVTRFGALHAAQATDADGAGHGDLVGQSEQDFDGGAFLNVFGEEEVDTAGADVAGFRAGLTDGDAGGPANRKGQAHGEALSGASFGASQGKPPLIECKVYPGKAQGTIGLRVQKEARYGKYCCTRTKPIF